MGFEAIIGVETTRAHLVISLTSSFQRLDQVNSRMTQAYPGYLFENSSGIFRYRITNIDYKKFMQSIENILNSRPGPMFCMFSELMVFLSTVNQPGAAVPTVAEIPTSYQFVVTKFENSASPCDSF